MPSSLNGTGLTFSSGQTLNSLPVTSAVAGNGITVSSATGAVTIALDIYTGTSGTNTAYPIGSTILVGFANNISGYITPGITLNSNRTLYVITGSGFNDTGKNFVLSGGSAQTVTALSGTWKFRGAAGLPYCVCIGTSSNQGPLLFQRVA